jgi:hypothetical protein
MKNSTSDITYEQLTSQETELQEEEEEEEEEEKKKKKKKKKVQTSSIQPKSELRPNK